MTQKADLYSILISYANKNNSPYIEIDVFLAFFEKYAKKMAAENGEWLKWTKDLVPKFWAELSALAEEEKCELLSDTKDGRIYMPRFYPKLIAAQYEDIDETAFIPFPSEEVLGIQIPESQVYFIGIESSLISYMQNPPEVQAPVICIGFSDDFGTALTLPEFIPGRLAEASLLKIRNYLRNHGNREYAYNKLAPQLAGKEGSLRGILEQILVRPLDCYKSIEDGADFSYLFWAHFSILVKSDVKKKKDKLSDDIAAFQAICILEAINGYFKELAVKKRERDAAFRDLEAHLKKPPFLFSLDQIIKFTNSRGVLLLGQYNMEELENQIKKQTAGSENNELPPLLVVKEDGETRFINKFKLPFLCARLLGESREKVKSAITKHWTKLLRNYLKEPAMENDKDFEKLLERYTAKSSKTLAGILEDPKLQIIYDEMEQAKMEIPLAAKIFRDGKLMPYSGLLLLKRKDLLDDARLFLPFWFSIPFLTAIISFFKNLSRKPKQKESSSPGEFGEDAFEETPEETSNERETSRERYLAAKEIEASVIPPGYTLDSWLAELEGRWSRLINKQARDNLVEDIHSLVRDNLRRTLRIQKKYKITRENLSHLAGSIVSHTPSLQQFGEKDSLVLYIELYLVKLLQTIQF